MPWIFGYGSLLWNPGFPYRERLHARLDGWQRLFWQGSTDHRGRPGNPGRVVTLVRDPGSCCEGLAFRVAGRDFEGIAAWLDYREKGGYRRLQVEVRFRSGATFPCLTYYADPANLEFLGPAPLHLMAAQIRKASGPTGPNLDYLLRLARTLRSLGIVDQHVFRLERLCSPLTGSKNR